MGAKWKEGDFEYTCSKSDNVYAKELVTESGETHVGKRTSVEIFGNFIIHFLLCAGIFVLTSSYPRSQLVQLRDN